MSGFAAAIGRAATSALDITALSWEQRDQLESDPADGGRRQRQVNLRIVTSELVKQRYAT
jgi:hypothetical protein